MPERALQRVLLTIILEKSAPFGQPFPSKEDSVMKACKYYLLITVFLLSIAGCTATGARSPGPVIESYSVTNIDPATNAPDASSGRNIGHLDDDNPGAENNRIFEKRFAMTLKPNNTAINATRFEINYMSPTRTAMDNPMEMHPTVSSNSNGRLSFMTPSFSPPSNAAVCDWMHYRWSVEYSRPDGTDGVLIGQVQTLQMNGYASLSGGGIHPMTRNCDPIPQV
ncbi:MAG: hypothetical protein P8Z73_13490 [Desulfobacteraceae bacterium]